MGAVQSGEGFCYSIGLLVKAQRLGLRIGEVPALRLERIRAPADSGCLNGSWRISAGFLCLRNDLAAAPAETVILKALA